MKSASARVISSVKQRLQTSSVSPEKKSLHQSLGTVMCASDSDQGESHILRITAAGHPASEAGRPARVRAAGGILASDSGIKKGGARRRDARPDEGPAPPGVPCPATSQQTGPTP